MHLPSMCLSTLLLLATATSGVHAQIAVDHELLILQPDSLRTSTLTLRNEGPSNARMSVRLEDWSVDARGRSHWQKAGVVTGSCGRRVSISPASFDLAPSEQQVVQVAVHSDARFDAECWSAAVIRSLVSGTRERASAAPVIVPLYVTPAGLRPDGELTDMYVKGDSLEVVFRNTGQLRADIVGEIQVQTADNTVITTVPLDSTTVLVGATRNFRVAMPKLPRGQYVLVALVDFGGDQLTAVQAALDIR